MSVYLADGNVLVALSVADHLHHGIAMEWFDGDDTAELATCPITEGTLLRFLLRERLSVADAMAVLDGMRAQDWYHFWPDSLPYQREQLAGVVGHRQVTDAYLVALARERGGKVVSFDKGMKAVHQGAVHLLTS